MKKSYVYKITCKINGEFYFGSSFKAKRDSYWGGGKRIRERVAQYGKENFIKEILGEFDDRVEAHKVENYYIEQFRHDVKCLNIHLDHRFGTYGEETRARIGAASAITNRGKTLSEETRAKIGCAMIGEKNPMFGKHHTDETRAKIGAASAIAHRGENNPMFGKHHTDETRARMSAAHLGKHHTEEAKAKIGAASAISMLGKKFSEEHRAKIGAAKLGKHWRKNPVTGKREYYD